ncbi:hypothetical protein ACIQ4I_12465 [Rummeliibacillus sp. NPDC094406]|uniref:hypothetical protein n=1 Tax=Rummeliibacillus sp. NPDC094406 TaxID=3364511 RepID=UPI0038198180
MYLYKMYMKHYILNGTIRDLYSLPLRNKSKNSMGGDKKILERQLDHAMVHKEDSFYSQGVVTKPDLVVRGVKY